MRLTSIPFLFTTVLLASTFLTSCAYEKSAAYDYDNNTNGGFERQYDGLYANADLEESRDKAKEKEILKFIFGTIILGSENAVDYIDEHFTNWEDEGDMMIGFVLNYIQKPGSINFHDLVGDEKMKFAVDLLQTAIDKKSITEEIIKPKLNNWDPERIAMIDMILLRLGVCELVYFDTIPTKVTINEYIDLAKEYSTEQSGHFVNGILDSIHKELVGNGKIQKVSYKGK
jgi:N utilization substance protein B